jgi:hypothetical protein
MTYGHTKTINGDMLGLRAERVGDVETIGRKSVLIA